MSKRPFRNLLVVVLLGFMVTMVGCASNPVRNSTRSQLEVCQLYSEATVVKDGTQDFAIISLKGGKLICDLDGHSIFLLSNDGACREKIHNVDYSKEIENMGFRETFFYSKGENCPEKMENLNLEVKKLLQE